MPLTDPLYFVVCEPSSRSTTTLVSSTLRNEGRQLPYANILPRPAGAIPVQALP